MSSDVTQSQSHTQPAVTPGRESSTNGVIEWAMVGIGVTAFLGVIAKTFLPDHYTGIIMSCVSMAILWFMFGFGYSPRKANKA